MREPFDWVKRVLGGAEPRNVLALLTPEATRSRGPALRLAVAGGTALLLMAAGSVALLSLGALMAAMAIIYFLGTQVLGLKIDLDPSALYREVRRQAAAYGPN